MCGMVLYTQDNLTIRMVQLCSDLLVYVCVYSCICAQVSVHTHTRAYIYSLIVDTFVCVCVREKLTGGLGWVPL